VAHVQAAEAQAIGGADDGLELTTVLRERTSLGRRRADETYPRTRETREKYTDASGYDAGYGRGYEADGSCEKAAMGKGE